MIAVKKKGFTLVELLVVMIIVGVLATIAVPMMSNTITKAKKTEAMAALGAIRQSQKLYHIQYGQYASGLNALQAASFLNFSELSGKYFTESIGSSGVAGNYSTDASGTATATVPDSLGGGVMTLDIKGNSSGY